MKLLTLNSGSSSLKLSVYDFADGERRVLSRIVRGPQAADEAASYLETSDLIRGLDGIGHRLVHGGSRYSEPVVISKGVLSDLHKLTPLSPIHLRPEISLIERMRIRLPDVPQVACFDTAFHFDMPEIAHRLPLSVALTGSDVRRYGFHGLSCESVLEFLRREQLTSDKTVPNRILIAHLGSGASVSAIRDFKSVDTTMGFTPLGGVMMASRPGDLDPGVFFYLLREKKISLEALERWLEDKSGLAGVSEMSGDMQMLLANTTAEAVRNAIDLFCYSVQKAIASLSVPLGGIDLLVFTGGVGENAASIRDKICAGLSHLGRFSIRVIPANEEQMIARKTYKLLMRRDSL
jgi:acetate kinase